MKLELILYMRGNSKGKDLVEFWFARFREAMLVLFMSTGLAETVFTYLLLFSNRHTSRFGDPHLEVNLRISFSYVTSKMEMLCENVASHSSDLIIFLFVSLLIHYLT